MCGRFVQSSDAQALESTFGSRPPFPVGGRFNIAPSQLVASCHLEHPETASLWWAALTWGFRPHWAKPGQLKSAPINARAETVADKPMFRHAFKQHRCLVPADGYYEWQPRPGQAKQPYYIHRADNAVIALAGIFSPAEEDTPGTLALLTTAAAPSVQAIHERMPVTVEPNDFEAWLAGDVAAAERVIEHAGKMKWISRPVSPRMNRPTFDSPECIDALPEASE